MPTHSVPSFDRRSSPFTEKPPRFASPRSPFAKSPSDRSNFTTPDEFLRKDSQEKDPSHWNNRAGQPRIMSGSQRYLRYILFAFVTIAILYFITSSSSTPRVPGSQYLPSTPDLLKGKTPGSPKADDTLLGDTIDDEKTAKVKTPSPSPPKIPEPAPAPVPIDNKKTPNPLPHGQTPFPAGDAPGPRMNATFVTLARNSDVWEIARSIRQVEDRFNHKYHYDWVFLNDADFDDQFKKITSALTSGNTKYGKITKDHWGFPEWIDQDKARRVREDMKERKIIYGDSISYRHMCRYESGFFFRHELMLDYEWYWRVEPSVELFCDVAYDPFKYMADHKKKYSFVISLYEYAETIPTLWDSTKKFMQQHPEHIAEDNSIGFLSDDGGKTYNKCHFWSNFEIGSLEWLRSDAYIDFFTSLDHDGGFFYERWGDAPIHSIAAALMLKKDEIHFFDDIAYYHVPFTHCPTGEQRRLDLKCHCNPSDNFDWKGYSCTKRFFEVNKKELPAGYEKEQ